MRTEYSAETIVRYLQNKTSRIASITKVLSETDVDLTALSNVNEVAVVAVPDGPELLQMLAANGLHSVSAETLGMK